MKNAPTQSPIVHRIVNMIFLIMSIIPSFQPNGAVLRRRKPYGATAGSPLISFFSESDYCFPANQFI